MTNTISCFWFSGEETVIPCPPKIGDLRIILCEICEAVWGDIILFDEAHQVILEMSQDTVERLPTRVVTCILKTGIIEDYEWGENLNNHLIRRDAAGLGRCIEKMTKDNVTATLPNLWFGSLWETSRVQTFLDAKIDVEIKGDMNDTALHECAMKKYFEATTMLIAHNAQVNAVDNCRNTPLQLAVFRNATDIVEALLSANADLKIGDEDQLTPLHWSARGDGVLTKMLLDARCEPNVKTRRGLTPLHWAVSFGKEYTVRLLLAANANTNSQTDCGNTPLHWTLVFRKETVEEVEELLLKNGADMSLINKRGEKPHRVQSGWAKQHWRNATLLEGVKTLVRADIRKGRRSPVASESESEPESDA